MLHRRSTGTSATIASAAVLAILLMTGCSPAESEATKDYKAISGTVRLEEAQPVVACVKEKGFTVHADMQGGVGFESPKDVPADQHDLALAAIQDCRKELGLSDDARVPATPDQLKKLYKLNLEAQTCLEGKGFDLPDPPSEQAFVDTFHDAVKPPWSPWGLEMLEQLPADVKASDAIRLACPDPLPLVGTL